MPKLLVVKNNTTLVHYKKLARAADLELLYYLEKADMMGRVCADNKEQVEHIEWYKSFAQEFKLWPNNKPYADWELIVNKECAHYPLTTRQFILSNIIKDAEAESIYTVEEGIARSFAYRKHFSELVILCGPSGAGKTTWVKNNLSHFELISLDALRQHMTGKQENQKKNGQVLQAAKKHLKTYLAHKKNVVWDATNLRHDFRKQIIDIGLAYKAYITIVWFYCPSSFFYTKNKKRAVQVANEVISRQLDSFEWPELYEAHAYRVINEQGELIFSQ